MKNRFYIYIFIALVATLSFVIGAQYVNAAEKTFAVATNQASIVDLAPGTKKVFVVNPAIADVYTITRHRIAIIGKSPGHTGLLSFDSAGRKIMDAVVIVSNSAAEHTIKVNRGTKESTLACNDECVEIPAAGTQPGTTK